LAPRPSTPPPPRQQVFSLSRSSSVFTNAVVGAQENKRLLCGSRLGFWKSFKQD
jgi:hypothetical protein